MKRKRLLMLVGVTCLALILVAIPLMAACAKPAPEVVTLKFHTHMPEGHEANKWSRYWAEQVTEKTGGVVQFEMFYAGALGKGKDQPDNIKAGLFDVGYFLVAYDPAKTPLWNVIFVPWVPSMDPWVRAKALWDVSELQCMKEELARWDTMFLYPWAMGDIYHLYTVDKPVHTLDDIKGLKARSVGRMAEALALVEASPVAMPMPDVYDALQKGTINAGCFAWPPMMGYKLYEVVKYQSTIALGMGGPTMVMKSSVFNKLPADIQKVIMDVSHDMLTYMANREKEFLKTARQTFEEAGMTVIEFPEQEKYEEIAVMAVIEGWIKDMEDQGLPGREVYETFWDAALKYEKQPH